MSADSPSAMVGAGLANDLTPFSAEFMRAKPFPHATFDNFLSRELTEELRREMPQRNGQFDVLREAGRAFRRGETLFSSPIMVKKLGELCRQWVSPHDLLFDHTQVQLVRETDLARLPIPILPGRRRLYLLINL